MQHDYRQGVGGGQTSRRALGSLLRTVVMVSAAVAIVGALWLWPAACGHDELSTAPATVDDAYRSAHPKGNLPTDLATAPADIDRIARELAHRLPAEVPVVLPRPLPAGFGLAAPYVAIGSGAALPNPEVWPGGYRASFTDGRSLVVVAVNLSVPPAVDEAEPSAVVVGGRRLYEGADGQGHVLGSLPSDDWRLTLTGLGLSGAALEAFAARLRIVDWGAL